MHELDDHTLLRQYAEQNSENAFAALVARHVDKVYSTALRHTRNAHAAEEITQAVFAILAKKSGRLGAKVILAGWLYETARLTAVTYIRSEIRRARREQEAHMTTALNENDDDAWPHIAPLLDDALAGLSAADRHAVVLRYFDGKSLGEVGAALGASEDAAKKRVTRAVEKLRGYFTKRGVTLTATVLTAAITANSVQAAPLGLAATVTAMAKGTTVTAAVAALVKGTIKTMTWLKLKFFVGTSAALLVAGGVTTVLVSEDGDTSVTSVFQVRKVLDSASPDSEIFTNKALNSKTGETFDAILHLQNKALLDRKAIKSASVLTNSPIGKPVDIVVDFALTPNAKKLFAKITRENVGRRIAIIVDGKVICAPRIASEIPSGHGLISGQLTTEDAARIAHLISDPNLK